MTKKNIHTSPFHDFSGFHNNSSDASLSINHSSNDIFASEPEYLSDDMLNALIAKTEAEGLTTAPPDLAEQIMTDLTYRFSEQKRVRMLSEYKRYCIKVISTAAAAIMLAFAIPAYTGQHENTDITSDSGYLITAAASCDIFEILRESNVIYGKDRHSIFGSNIDTH